jgi:Leucine-rich repeat (LRR) protein
MTTTTSISSEDVTISTTNDPSTGGLWFNDNKEISYLPICVNESFTNLLAYSAYGCSLTKITKINFQGLSKLAYLELGGNQIETINSDTFKDLASLEYLWLSK